MFLNRELFNIPKQNVQFCVTRSLEKEELFEQSKHLFCEMFSELKKSLIHNVLAKILPTN